MTDDFSTPDIKRHQTHTSVMLRRLIDTAPPEHFTFDWLINRLPESSFGIILLFLSLFAMLPIISVPAQAAIFVLTFEAILGYKKPTLPRQIMNRMLPSRHLVRLNRHAIPLLELLETVVRPRWGFLLVSTRYVAGAMIILLTMSSLFFPLPFFSIPPSIITILIALAYIEHDGILLFFGYMLGSIIIGAMLWMIGMTQGAIG